MAYRLPTWIINVGIWRSGNPTTNPPDVLSTANFAMGRRTSKGDTAAVPYDPANLPTMDLLVPKGTDIRGDVDTLGAPDTVEIPVGSGSFWRVHFVHQVALGFPNEHLCAIVTPLGAAPPPPGSGFILLESGDFVLLESGDKILLE